MKIIFIYHEPWRGYIKEFKRQKNMRNFIKTCGRKFLSNKILKKQMKCGYHLLMEKKNI